MSEGKYLYEDWLAEHAACDERPCDVCQNQKRKGESIMTEKKERPARGTRRIYDPARVAKDRSLYVQ